MPDSANVGQISRLQLYDRFYENVHKRVIEGLRLQSNSKVLDVGCGAGGFTALMAQAMGPGGVVVALDVEDTHLAKTREAVAAQARQPSTIAPVVCCRGDVEDLQFLAAEFDLVWCSRVVHHHLPDPRRALSELYRVLKPEGRVAIRESGRRHLLFSIPELGITESFVIRLQEAHDRWFQSKFRSRKPNDSQWKRMLLQVGFRHPQVLTVPFVAPAPEVQAAYLQNWLANTLFFHESPEHGYMLDQEDVDKLKTLAAEDNSSLCARDVEMREETAVYVAYK